MTLSLLIKKWTRYDMKTLNKHSAWASLEENARALDMATITSLNQNTIDREQHYSASSCNIHLNYSNQRVTDKTLELLFSLAEQCQLREKIHALMRGDKVNYSEDRPALHTALRANNDTPIWVDTQNVMTQISDARVKMQLIIDKIRQKKWLGHSGKTITDIVNIGIGGSDLGPRFCLKALADYTSIDLGYHFISDVDPTGFNTAVAKLNPETTLFIISSKSFTTKETLYNAKKAKDWINSPAHLDKHFIAVTANPEQAQQFGIHTVLPIWDWVGGRFSLCSSINLITAIAIGFEAFNQLLSGANSMDNHFHNTEFNRNLPVILALLGIWNNNFFNIHNLLILTYTQKLEQFVPFVQQIDMESNGKSIDNQGNPVKLITGPIVWGGLGNQAQHSYYQLLCQGTHKITADFITADTFDDQIINTMCEAKIQVLTEGVHDQINAQAHIPGNISLNHIRIKDCSPFTIGELVALYEHKIFTQSVIWDINPFDQPGVESAKTIPMFLRMADYKSPIPQQDLCEI